MSILFGLRAASRARLTASTGSAAGRCVRAAPAPVMRAPLSSTRLTTVISTASAAAPARALSSICGTSTAAARLRTCNQLFAPAASTSVAGGGRASGMSLLRQLLARRGMATTALDDPVAEKERLTKTRNIGISAHIDSGKTTLTERVLFYSGRIHDIHEVRGKDEKGAFMDSMELEREKGITIQSAATHTTWAGHHINLIDTPGHVDFTIEVERSLRVLDGAVLVLCGVSGVQSQSMTVDKQMKRYKVPRICFINKLDRTGADPWAGINDLRTVLGQNAAAVQIPIGAEEEFEGVIDIIERKAYNFDGDKGSAVAVSDVPDEYKELMEEKRKVLIEAVANVDEQLGELFVAETEPTVAQLKAAIRRQTIALNFIPVFMGSAYKNKGVQPMLDGVVDYLPAPTEVTSTALDQNNAEKPVALSADSSKPLVALAFKLEERPFGQLTYLRIYQGALRKKDTIVEPLSGRRVKIPRVVRMHSNLMEDIDEAGAGEIVAMFGVDCHSGTTFTNGELRYTLTSMYVPEPVISLSITPKKNTDVDKFGKALARFQKEDPTFRVNYNAESQQTIILGMGELHLDIYCERIRREFKVDVVTGNPQVNFREALTKRANFNYTHKKQSGGSGQFGRVAGYIEPLPMEDGSGVLTADKSFVFENRLVGNAIPPEFHSAIEKGMREAIAKGELTGYPVQGVRVVITDGAAHSVDSNEVSFRQAAQGGFREAYRQAGVVVLEPIMAVEVQVPIAHQASVVGGLNRRRGLMQSVEARDAGFTIVKAHLPLEAMFGYSTDLRSSTEGKGEYSMEYLKHEQVTKDRQLKLQLEYQEQRAADLKAK